MSVEEEIVAREGLLSGTYSSQAAGLSIYIYFLKTMQAHIARMR